MNPLVCLILFALWPMAAQATTVYRCDVAGVPTFQDQPCTASAAVAGAADSPRAELLKERRNRLLQRRRVLMAELLELQSQAPDETAAGGDYEAQAERQRLQWTHRAQLEQARQRLARLDDNLRLLQERITRLAVP